MLAPRSSQDRYPRSSTMLSDAHIDIAQLVEHERGTQVVGWSYAAAVALLIYDFLITLDDEVHLIWPTPWSFIKFVFIFVRYFPVALEMSTQFYGTPLYTYSPYGCYIWNVHQGLSSVLIVACVDYILILRVYAMYPRNKPVRSISALLYAAELVTMSVGIALAVPKLKFDSHCVVTKSPLVFLIAAGCPIVYQAFLFAVTMCKFVQAVRSGWGNVPFMQLLVRDGTWAFGLLFAVLISEAALYGFAAKAYTGFLYGWLNTAFSICGYRILLNIHNLNSKTARFRTVITDTNIVFTSNIDTSMGSEGVPTTGSEGEVGGGWGRTVNPPSGSSLGVGSSNANARDEGLGSRQNREEMEMEMEDWSVNARDHAPSRRGGGRGGGIGLDKGNAV